MHKAMLEAVAAFDERRLWQADGATSAAAWLVARLGVSYGTATAWSETAARLQNLPALSAAYEEGRLSWDQVRAAAEVADAGNEEAVLAQALGASAAQLERAARRQRERVGPSGEAIHAVVPDVYDMFEDLEHRLVHGALRTVQLSHGVGEIAGRCGGEERSIHC